MYATSTMFLATVGYFISLPVSFGTLPLQHKGSRLTPPPLATEGIQPCYKIACLIQNNMIVLLFFTKKDSLLEAEHDIPGKRVHRGYDLSLKAGTS